MVSPGILLIMRYLLILFILFGVVGFIYNSYMNNHLKTNTHKYRYFVVGDSYSIGEGATKEESWPSLLTKHLQDSGVDIELIANPSVTGWTTQQAIDNELPLYESSEVTFASLQIGVNDWAQGVDKDTFHKNLVILLDRMQKKLPEKNLLLLVTIPDFGVTPTGELFGNGVDVSKGIEEFNQIIKDEAKTRQLPIVDIYPVSRQMQNNPDLVAQDGLHPSAKEYKIWESLIYPVAYKLLSDDQQAVKK